jgi:ssDNA-binding replication factor A large subunit
MQARTERTLLKINEVEVGKNVADLVVRVWSVGPARMIATRTGRKTQLTEVLVVDETGTAVLSLWGFGAGEDLRVGQVIRITDGWAKEWQGKIQLSLGRSGRFEVVSDDGSLPQISELSKGHAKGSPETRES